MKTQIMGLDQELASFADWLRNPPPEGKPRGERTVTAYLWHARTYHEFLNGRGVQQETAQDFVGHLAEAGNSLRSIALYTYGLRAYFAFSRVPLDLRPPSYSRRPSRWLTDDEWSKVLAEAVRPLSPKLKLPKHARHRALFHRAALMVYREAALKLSEGIELRREAVKTPRGHISVLSNGREQLVPVSDEVIIALQEWMATHDSPWVFPGRGDGHLHHSAMHAAIRGVMKRAGIQDIRRVVEMLRPWNLRDWRTRDRLNDGGPA